jgi:hypothetical protein
LAFVINNIINMLGTFFHTRRLLRSKAVLTVSQRAFSNLLVPITPAITDLPAELRDYPLTTQSMKELQESYTAFNNQCGEELKEMNQNRITNIIERGGVEGWETVSEALE